MGRGVAAVGGWKAGQLTRVKEGAAGGVKIVAEIITSAQGS